VYLHTASAEPNVKASQSRDGNVDITECWNTDCHLSLLSSHNTAHCVTRVTSGTACAQFSL